jgi:hypothetical protein
MVSALSALSLLGRSTVISNSIFSGYLDNYSFGCLVFSVTDIFKVQKKIEVMFKNL